MAEVEHESLSELLHRAHEIEEQTGLLTEQQRELLAAAEEAGLSRDATIQALRERLAFSAENFEEGKLVFARSADGHFYVAKLTKVSGDQAKVRFMGSGDATVSIYDLRSFALIPGVRVHCSIQEYGMWFEAQVVNFNPDTLNVRVNYWGTEQNVAVDKIRLEGKAKIRDLADRGKMWSIAVGAALAGTAAGMLIMKLLMR